MKTIVRGRAWSFGDDVGIGSMIRPDPAVASWPSGRESLFPHRPEFVEGVQPGDIIVAGRHWGRGIEVGEALDNLSRLGVAAVVAVSFARPYFEEGLRVAFPNFCCHGVIESCLEGDEIEFDLEWGTLVNLTQGIELRGEAYTIDMFDVAFQGSKPSLGEETIRPQRGSLTETHDLHLVG